VKVAVKEEGKAPSATEGFRGEMEGPVSPEAGSLLSLLSRLW